MKVSFDSAFKRAYRKRIAPSEKLKKRFDELLPIFITDPFDARLRTHKAVFVDVGSHDEVY